MDLSNRVELRVVMTREDLEHEQAIGANGLVPERVEPIAAPPPGLGEARFIETVAVICTITLAEIARRLVNDWLKRNEQGVQIDLRTIPPTISMIANIPRGYLVIIDKNGESQVQKAEYDKETDLAPLLSKVLSGGQGASGS
jgi:hypothetical protein